MLTVTRAGNVVTVVESIFSFHDTKRKTVVYNLDTRELRVNDEPARTMSEADVRRVTALCERRALTGNPNIQYPLESVDIAAIRAGDTIYHEGEYLTVCAKDIKRNGCGISIFGDSYRSGRVPVRRALTTQGRRVESPAVEKQQSIASRLLAQGGEAVDYLWDEVDNVERQADGSDLYSYPDGSRISVTKGGVKSIVEEGK